MRRPNKGRRFEIQAEQGPGLLKEVHHAAVVQNFVPIQPLPLFLVQLGFGQILPLAGDKTHRGDGGQRLVHIQQKVHIPGAGQAGHFSGKGPQIVGADDHVPARLNVVVGPDKEGDGILLQDFLGGPFGQFFSIQHFVKGIGQGRLVVTEKDHHGGLLLLAVVGNQLLQGQVALLHQGEKLFRSPVRRFLELGQLNVPLQVVPALGVAAVILHGDVEEEQGAVRLLGGPAYHVVIRPVGDVAADDVRIGHVLLV